MNHYESQGILSVLPGLELVLDSIRSEVDRMLELVKGEESENATEIPRRGPRQLLPQGVNPTHHNGSRKRSMIARRTWQKKTAKQKRDWIAAINRGRRLKKEAKA